MTFLCWIVPLPLRCLSFLPVLSHLSTLLLPPRCPPTTTTTTHTNSTLVLLFLFATVWSSLPRFLASLATCTLDFSSMIPCLATDCQLTFLATDQRPRNSTAAETAIPNQTFCLLASCLGFTLATFVFFFVIYFDIHADRLMSLTRSLTSNNKHPMEKRMKQKDWLNCIFLLHFRMDARLLCHQTLKPD